MKRRICVVITARPSYARIKTVLRAAQQRDDVELLTVVAGSALLDRYGRVVDVIEKDGFPVTERVYMLLEGENLVTSAKSTGLAIVELATVLDNLKPDVVVTIADRYETLATAVAASYMNLPVAHVQGGEVSGSIDEKVRHAVTKLSNMHLVANQQAADRVVRMGEDPANVFVTGCPSIDIAATDGRRELDFDPFERYGGVGPQFSYKDGYLVVMQHPVTTEFDLSRQHVTETIEAVRQLNLPTFWFWPNPDAGSDGTSKGIRAYREIAPDLPIHFFKNMTAEDFLTLINNSRCLVGNSSVGIRESAYLGIPTVNIGNRQRGRTRGRNVIDVDYDRTQIARALERHLRNGRYASDPVYGDGKAGERIATLLAEAPLSIEKILTY
jgi:UDP-hydrolysing UDP-N-acetyl-D-glucosamine 2-epimerase